MRVLSAEYALLVAVAFCGFGAIPALIAVPVGVVGLLFSSWPKYFALWPRARAVNKVGALGVTMGLSALNAAVAVLAAFALGWVLRLVAVGAGV